MGTKQQLNDNVLTIVNAIEQGIEVTQDDIDSGYYDEGQYEAGDIISGFDYLADVLDITWILFSDKTYKGAEVLVGFGGPNLWIDTVHNTVHGTWGGDKVSMSYHDDVMGIDEALEELFNC